MLEYKNIKVSVIVPVYNVEKFLPKCLNSILCQTLSDIEIICVNDGSSDKSKEILEEYSLKDSRIKLINQKNCGVSQSRNNAIKMANGEFVMFMDSDDYYPSNDILKTLYEKAKDNDVFICGGEFSDFYDENMSLNQIFKESLDGYIFPQEGIIEYSDYQFDYGFHRFMYNRKFLLEHNISFPLYKRFEDPPFLVHALIEAKRFYALNKIVYAYRINYKKLHLKTKDTNDFLSGLRDNFMYAQKYNLSQLRNYSYMRFKEHLPLILASLNKKSFELINEINVYCSEINESAVKKALVKYKLSQIFSIKNADDNIHKILTILGLRIKYSKKSLASNYSKILKRIKKKDKINICFLVNEISKWKSQSLYDLMAKSDKFIPHIILTIADIQYFWDVERQEKFLYDNAKFFEKKNMPYSFAYDFNKHKVTNLKRFKPDIIFYQQPYEIYNIQKPRRTSKYTLNCYIPYFVPNYGFLSMDCGQELHRDVWRFYVLNEEWANIYRQYMKKCSGSVVGLGHTMLDEIYLNNDQTQDYVIYAPHWTIPHKNNPTPIRCSTFADTGKIILEYAKKHKDIKWVFKPHPTLKVALERIGWTKDEIENYYNEWEQFAKCCYDSEYMELFLKSKAMITDCGSFLIEYFCTGKPLIHLISSYCKVSPPKPTQDIFETFYQVYNSEDLYKYLDEIIVKNNDYMKDKRVTVLKEQNLLNNYAAKNILDDLSRILAE